MRSSLHYLYTCYFFLDYFEPRRAAEAGRKVNKLHAGGDFVLLAIAQD